MDICGKINNCEWEITDDGTLVIRPDKEGTAGHLRLNEVRNWPWRTGTFRKVRIDGDVSVSGDISYMFSSCAMLEDIADLKKLDTSGVTDMSWMFAGCTALKDISALEGWNTSGVTDMNGMFFGCTALSDVSALKDLDVSNVANMSNMFGDCTALCDISSLAGWNSGNIVSMGCMFFKCAALKDISALGSWDTKKVENIHSVFCLTSLEDASPLAGWDTGRIVDMAYAFSGCTALEDISALKNWNVSSVVYMSSMFAGCTALKDISALEGWQTSSVTDMNGMFRGCTALENIDGLEGWDVSNVENMDLMFTDCTRLMDREKLFDEWQLKNGLLHYRAAECGSAERVVSERRMFAMSDGPMTCPREGDFIGWKKCRGNLLVKLLIPADAKRTSSLNKECRCEKAFVLDITNRKGEHKKTAVSKRDTEFVYRVGKTVCVPDFCEDRFRERAPGIHFFMDKTSAVNYWND